MVDGDEVCDDGVNDGAYDGCLPDCSATGPHCGDGIEQGNEICDDGDEIDGNGCNVDCVISGSVLWTQTFDGAFHGSDGISGVAITPADAIVAVGFEDRTDDARRAWIREYDADGNTAWTETWDGATGDFTLANAVAIDDVGGIYVGGAYDAVAQGNNAWVRKYDDRVALEYSHTSNGASNGNDQVRGLAVSGDGYLVGVGEEFRTTGGHGVDLWVRRLGQDGSEFWTRTDGGTGPDTASAVAIDGSGNIIMIASLYAADSDILVRKYDQDGTELWSTPYDGGGSDYAAGIAVDSQDRIVISASIGDEGGLSNLTRLYDADGNELWSDVFDSGNDGGYSDSGRAVTVDSDDNVIVVGSSAAGGAAGSLAWLRKLDADGEEIRTTEWNIGVPVDFAFTLATSVAIDSSNNIVVGGLELLDGTPSDAWVRKIAP